MVKLVATGYSDDDSCEEIFLDDDFRIVSRKGVEGVRDASFIAGSDFGCYFVSEESENSASIHRVCDGNVSDILRLDTKGIVCLCFLEKYGIIVSGSYTTGEIFFDEKCCFRVNSAHCIVTDDLERFLYVTDIKGDSIFVYDLVNKRLLEPVKLSSGVGPRHIRCYRDFLYLVTEYSNEVYVFSRDEISGELTFINKCASFYGDFSGKNYASTLDIKDDILVVSNRGKNVISFFRILDSGDIMFLYGMDCNGDWPRDLKIFGGYLFVANERSGNISIFELKSQRLVSSVYKKGVNNLFLLKEDFYGVQD